MCGANTERNSDNDLDVDKIPTEEQANNNYFFLSSTYESFYKGMFKYMNSSPLVFVYALILIDRIQESHEDFYMT